MSIFKKSLFDLRSGEQRAADYAAYQEYMFPLGAGQQGCIKAALKGAPKKTGEEKLLFLFYVAKERYVECRMEKRERPVCCQEAWKALKKFPFSPKENLPYLFSLLLLDLDAQSLEDYPAVSDIEDLRRRLFAGGREPDWTELP